MRNVIVLNDTATINGGATKVAISSAIALKRIGINVEFFAGCGPVDAELKATVPTTCLHQDEILRDPNRLRAATRGMANAGAAAALGRLLARKSPAETVLHLHSWTKSLTATVVRTASKLGFPVVLSLHDYFISCPNGALLDFGRNKVCRRRPLGLSCLVCNCDARKFVHKVWRVARTVIQNKFLRLPGRVSLFVATSEFSRRILAPWLPPGTPVVTIFNPIDVRKEPPVNVGRNTRLLYAGRLAPEKGVLLLADCANRMGVPVLYVGEGEMAGRIRAVHRQAEILPWADKGRLLEIMGESRVLLFPSQWYEASPVLPMEALARGLPVIVSTVSAASDSVLDNISGLHFDASTADDLCAKLKLISDPALASRLGQGAYTRYWDDPCTLEKHALCLLQAYDSLSGGAAGPSGFRLRAAAA